MKKYNYKVYVFSSDKLTEQIKNKIFKLKNSHYKFSLKKQRLWFQNNVAPKDKHILLFKSHDLIGYNCLRIKKALIHYYKKKNKLEYLYLFDTLILNKNYRGLGLSEMIMKKSDYLINKQFGLSILICLKKMIKYYENFDWHLLSKKQIQFANASKQSKKIMIRNCNQNLKNFKKIEIL